MAQILPGDIQRLEKIMNKMIIEGENDYNEREKDNRNKWLHLGLNTLGYKAIQQQFASTTDLEISDFARKKPLSELIETVRKTLL